jgi:hypothetical protein
MYLGLGLRLGSGTFAGFDADAAAYFDRAGVTDATAKAQINSFVVGVKALGLYNNMVCWPLRSTQNAGTGLTAYSLGGLGTFNGTLSSPNGPTWGASGITFDGTDDYLLTGYTGGLSEFSAFSIATPNSTAGVQYEFSKDDAGSNREWGILAALSGYNQGFLWNPTLTQLTGPLAGTTSRLLCLRASSTVFKFRRNNESDVSGATGTLTQTSANLTIGARAGGGGLYFNGTISASILFNVVLSDSDTSAIYSLYNSTLGSNFYDPFAESYFTTAGITDTTAKQQISDFVVGVKALGLWNNMVSWPLRSAQNAGTGTTAYSLGGFGTFNGTLTGGPTWGTDGITFDGTNDYILTTLTSGFSAVSVFSISKNDAISQIMQEVTKDDEGSNREWAIFGDLGGLFQGRLFNPFTQINGPAVTTDFKSLCLRGSTTVVNFRRNNESGDNGAAGALIQGSAQVTFGAKSGGGDRWFAGIMAGVIIFNTALSDSDTSSIYTLYKNTIGTGLGLP